MNTPVAVLVITGRPTNPDSLFAVSSWQEFACQGPDVNLSCQHVDSFPPIEKISCWQNPTIVFISCHFVLIPGRKWLGVGPYHAFCLYFFFIPPGLDAGLASGMRSCPGANRSQSGAIAA
ncbi:hypothetical protein [Herbaspirillum rubrisubalbicans]|uniref:hypothetical protein n=1 Tax=Herbaspirillum rubrisubalbicans TaxID=80842 RepID=UPI0013DD9F7B|nr:hypothetical protein [Herbaspirillum rubrisubalbicans]